MAKYAFHYHSPDGLRLATMNKTIASFTYTRSLDAVGVVSVNNTGVFPRALLVPDSQIRVFRTPTNGVRRLETLGFVRYWKYQRRGDVDATLIKGFDPNVLLERRIVAYDAGTSQSTKTGAADDVMKSLFDENFLASATDSDRDLSGAGLSVEYNLGDGPTITRSFSRKNVLSVLRQLQDATRAAGNECYFWLQPIRENADGTVSFQFKTATGQPGIDRTARTGAAPVYFGDGFGNVENPELEFDFRAAVSYVYGAGTGEQSERQTADVSDAALIAASPFGRIEAYADARNESDADGITAAARAVLTERRPRFRFSCRIIDTEQTRYGVDWDLGDRVTVSGFGGEYSGIVRAVSVTVKQSGEETVMAQFEATGTIA